MENLVLYRKYRPKIFAEVVNQEHVVRTLTNALALHKVAHAYLFTGPRGTGKTTIARLLAKAVNCEKPVKNEPCNKCAACSEVNQGQSLDLIEIDAASNRGIDEIRELKERVNYAPNQARYKVYIIDEVHMLTKEASNALLKTLEEPPPSVIFVLATTEAHKVLPTIMSRCQRFDFRRVSQKDIALKLNRICSSEGINIEEEALKLIAKSASGSLRDAENLLEQLFTYYGSDIGLSQIQAILGVTGDERARELVEHIVNNNISAGMKTINAVSSDGIDLKQFSRELVAYLRGLLLIKNGCDKDLDLTTEEIAKLKDLAKRTSMEQILRAVKLFGQLEPGFNDYSTLPLELALVDCILTSAEEKIEPVKPVKAEPIKPVKTATKPVTSQKKKQPETEPEAAEIPTPVAEIAVFSPSASDNILEQLQSNWRQIIEQAPEGVKRTPAVAILRSAGVKPVALEGDTIILTFRYSYHKEKIEEPENKKITAEIISNFLGHSCQVRCVYEPEENHLVKEAQKIGAQIIDVEEK